MTCIIGAFDDKEVVFVADSRQTAGFEIKPTTSRKLLRCGGRLYGFAGRVAAIQSVRRAVVEDGGMGPTKLARSMATLAKDWETDEREIQVLLYDRDQLFHVYGDGTTVDIDYKFHSIGSGEVWALGAVEALWPERRRLKHTLDSLLETAMYIAANHDSAVDNRLQWERMGR